MNAEILLQNLAKKLINLYYLNKSLQFAWFVRKKKKRKHCSPDHSTSNERNTLYEQSSSKLSRKSCYKFESISTSSLSFDENANKSKIKDKKLKRKTHSLKKSTTFLFPQQTYVSGVCSECRISSPNLSLDFHYQNQVYNNNDFDHLHNNNDYVDKIIFGKKCRIYTFGNSRQKRGKHGKPENFLSRLIPNRHNNKSCDVFTQDDTCQKSALSVRNNCTNPASGTTIKMLQPSKSQCSKLKIEEMKASPCCSSAIITPHYVSDCTSQFYPHTTIKNCTSTSTRPRVLENNPLCKEKVKNKISNGSFQRKFNDCTKSQCNHPVITQPEEFTKLISIITEAKPSMEKGRIGDDPDPPLGSFSSPGQKASIANSITSSLRFPIVQIMRTSSNQGPWCQCSANTLRQDGHPRKTESCCASPTRSRSCKKLFGPSSACNSYRPSCTNLPYTVTAPGEQSKPDVHTRRCCTTTSIAQPCANPNPCGRATCKDDRLFYLLEDVKGRLNVEQRELQRQGCELAEVRNRLREYNGTGPSFATGYGPGHGAEYGMYGPAVCGEMRPSPGCEIPPDYGVGVEPSCGVSPECGEANCVGRPRHNEVVACRPHQRREASPCDVTPVCAPRYGPVCGPVGRNTDGYGGGPMYPFQFLNVPCAAPCEQPCRQSWDLPPPPQPLSRECAIDPDVMCRRRYDGCAGFWSYTFCRCCGGEVYFCNWFRWCNGSFGRDSCRCDCCSCRWCDWDCCRCCGEKCCDCACLGTRWCGMGCCACECCRTGCDMMNCFRPMIKCRSGCKCACANPFTCQNNMWSKTPIPIGWPSGYNAYSERNLGVLPAAAAFYALSYNHHDYDFNNYDYMDL